MAGFEILPAIDLEGGRVVRLMQGDFARETVYEHEPVAVAREFADAGATWLHVVDLDGAREGEPRQLELVAEIVAEVHGRIRVEVGGGLRTAEAVAGALGTGASRVAVGTAALRDPAFALGIVARYGPGRVVGSLDIRDGMAYGEGWRRGSEGVLATDALEMLSASGIDTFEVTAIDRDGLLGGPDVPLLRSLVRLGRGRIIASGGISSLDDVLAVQAAGCAGVIVGRALYEGRIGVHELINAIEGHDLSR
ncbi:MAG TPA: 1-(5-phosphoribosyl)-5-[(5-phosphoribosylamino)methylideneamino] imidazole-4-carboxamide isomerase [Candidatus Limnocylindrales bacterium]